MADDYTLSLPFDSDSADFVRGFEAGRIWSILQADDDRHDFMVHATNVEMMLRMGERTDRQVRTEEIYPQGQHRDMWMAIFFSEVGGEL